MAAKSLTVSFGTIPDYHSGQSTPLKSQPTYRRIIPRFASQFGAAAVLSVFMASSALNNAPQISDLDLSNENAPSTEVPFNPVARLQEKISAAYDSPYVAQSVASKLGHSIESNQIAVPHTILNGEITAQSAKDFLNHLIRGLNNTGRDKYFYVFINTPGGSVSEGYKILEALNHLYEQQGFKKMRVVVTSANSMGLPIAAGFSGKRMILEDASIMAHAPYLRLPNGTACKFGEACLTQEQEAMIQDDINKFADIVAKRSCVLTQSEAALYFTPKDRPIDVSEMMRFDMADHVFHLTSKGWVQVQEQYNPGPDKCKPIDITELLQIIDENKFIDPMATGGIVAPAPRPALRPKKRPFEDKNIPRPRHRPFN